MQSVTLHFYETSMPYGCFSNFAKYAVRVEGRVWATTEHFFQASKFSDPADVEAVRNAPTAFIAARLGRERHRTLRPDWDQVRDGVMLDALREKFAQHATIREVLASTSGARLVEHTSNDRYWGDGGDGSGKNRLGVLLEQVRSELPAWPAAFAAPPWIDHPDIEPSDVFWRRGTGEGDLMVSSRFYRTLSGDAKAHYDAHFPVPREWVASWR